MRKVPALMLMVMLACTCAYADDDTTAAPDTSPNNVASFTIQRDLGNATGFRTLDGLHVVYMGTFRAKQPEAVPESPDAEVKPDEGIFTVFMVRSDRDTTLKLDVFEGLDIRTNKFNYRSGDWGYIADSQVNGNTRDIPAGFWVRVTFWHDLPFRYGERPLIARVVFEINGNTITLKRFRPRTWGDWTYVEREYIAPLEEDNRRVEFEEMEITRAR